MANQPISLNLAHIVHRLLTNPRGWRVDDMRRELGIAERTYRKYRRVLREDFTPFVQRDGKTCVMELEAGGSRFLRLVDVDAAGVSDPEFDARVAAIYLAQATLTNAAGGMLEIPMQDLVAEFESGLRDRAFVQSRILDQADRMFATEYPEGGAANDAIVRDVLRALVHRRELCVGFGGDRPTERIQPLTIVMGASGLSLLASSCGAVGRFKLSDFTEVEVTADRFEYPSRIVYDPRRWLQN